jgi:hypothetical protein
MAVPIRRQRRSGVVCVPESGDEPFDDADQELIAAFASRAELR